MRTECNARQLKCAGQGARTGAATEAARSETGGVWQACCGFFATSMTSAGGNGPQHYCKLAYGGIRSQVSTEVAWRLTLQRSKQGL